MMTIFPSLAAPEVVILTASYCGCAANDDNFITKTTMHLFCIKFWNIMKREMCEQSCILMMKDLCEI